MSDIQILIDMGFSRERAERAIIVTNNKGVEPAMEWLLAHVDEDIPAGGETVESSNTAEPVASSSNVSCETSSADADGEKSPETTQEGGETDSCPQAKSIRCNECQKLFKNEMEAQFHAAKTRHVDFEESTEEKKPLTEEEKQQQLRLIEEKLKQKRAEREERDRQGALERERMRIKSGKDMTEAKRKMEEQEMQKIIEQKKREKAEEKAARDRVRAQIEADKAARKARLAVEMGQPAPAPQPVQSPATSSTTQAPISPKPSKDYTSSRIQIRLRDGTTLTETFNAKEQLSAVRVFVQVKQGMDMSFGLMTSFPRKVFTEDDYEKTLESLGLVPSAVLIVTKTP